MEQLIKIAADSVERLRSVDVFRVLEWCADENRVALAGYITKHRADLKDEVSSCLVELRGEQ